MPRGKGFARPSGRAPRGGSKLLEQPVEVSHSAQVTQPKTPSTQRRGVLTRVDGQVRAQPKDPREENPRLLELAHGRPCLFRWRKGCLLDDGSTTVACHENRLSAGKGAGYKAHDWRSAWGCYACHAAFDQPPSSLNLTHDDLDAVFAAAWKRQLHAWKVIAENPAEPAWARAAATWALDRVAARGVLDGADLLPDARRPG